MGSTSIFPVTPIPPAAGIIPTCPYAQPPTGESAPCGEAIDPIPKCVTYTGTGGDRFLNLDGGSDFVWIKQYATSAHHQLFDPQRGALQRVRPSCDTCQEDTVPDSVTSFVPSGVNLGASDQVNQLGQDYYAFGFTEQPFFLDIVLYQGTGSNHTVSHSLESEPEVMIIRERTGSEPALAWPTYVRAMGATRVINFAENGGSTTAASNVWQDTDPTETVFYVGSGFNVNRSGSDYVAYLLGSRPGVSSIGTYAGDQTNFPSIDCGFRPSLLWIRSLYDNLRDWNLFNTCLDPVNPVQKCWRTNLDANFRDFATDVLEITDNGFNIIGSNGQYNGLGETYLYMAFK